MENEKLNQVYTSLGTRRRYEVWFLKLALAGLAELADLAVEIADLVDFLVALFDRGFFFVGGQLGLLGVGLEFVDHLHVGLEGLEAAVKVGFGLGARVIEARFGILCFVVAGEHFVHIHDADFHLGEGRGGAENGDDSEGREQVFHRFVWESSVPDRACKDF